jgi:membrane protease YdiL (CAAX protease family)
MVSVTLQTLYHLYQGIPAAIALGAMFLILSAYFVKYGRVLPVILAHLYFDVLALLAYAN